MKQFKGLMIKEWNTYKKNFMVPIWIMTGIYALMILAVIIGYAKTGTISSNMDFSKYDQSFYNFFLYTISLGVSISSAFMVVVTTAGLVDNMLNDDFKKKCSIFHLAQPVELWKILSAKFVTILMVNLVLMVIIGFVNCTVFSTVYSILTGSAFLYGYLAFLQGVILSLSTIILILSTLWFLNSIFKDKGLLYGILIVGGIDIIILIFNAMYGTAIPAISQKYLSLTFSNIHIGFSNSQNLNMMIDHLGYADKLTLFIQQVWIECLNITFLIRIALSAVFLYIGYIFYKRRDIV